MQLNYPEFTQKGFLPKANLPADSHQSAGPLALYSVVAGLIMLPYVQR